MKSFWLSLFLILSVQAFPQHSAIDSMLQRNDSLEESIDKINNLINISREYFIMQDTQSLLFADKAIALSEKLDYELGKGQAYFWKAISYDMMNTDSMEHYFIKAAEILHQENHPWAGYCFENLTSLYIEKGWYPEALKYAIQSIENHKTNKDTIELIKTYSITGYLYTKLKDYDQSYRYLRKSLDLMGNRDIPEIRGLVFGKIGIMFDEQEKYDSALYYNAKAIEFFKKAHSYSYLSQWQSNIGNTYMKQKNYNKAEKYFIAANDNYLYDDQKAAVLNNLAKVYIETNRFDKAEKVLDSAG